MLSTARPDGAGLVLRFGPQVDIAPIRASAAGEELSAAGVARYVAKYVTKGDIPGLVLDRTVRSRGQGPEPCHVETTAVSTVSPSSVKLSFGCIQSTWLSGVNRQAA